MAEGRGRRERAVGRPGPAPDGLGVRAPRQEEARRGRAVVERREEERRAAVLVGVVQVDVRCCFQQVFHLFGVSGCTGVPEFVFITADRGGGRQPASGATAWLRACAGVVRCSAAMDY